MTGLDIKIARLKAGIKGYEMARMLGITPDKLSQIEVGRVLPNEELLKRINIILKPTKKQLTEKD